MKHLRVLEDAGLVTTRRRGREKLHFLNPVPVRLVHDRWVSKYAEPWAAGLSGLKRSLEDDLVTKAFELYIRTTPARLWEAITRDSLRRRYWFGVGVASEWTAGSSYEARHPSAIEPVFAGRNIELDPPRRLVQSFTAMWSEEARNAGESRITWQIDPIADTAGTCRLLVTHDQLRPDGPADIWDGWPQILSGLKTLLETGEPLTTPGSLRFPNAA
jgi:uncharacterized protein YndB with AHSA1/START domain